MPQETLKLVHVVGAFAASSSVLAVNGVDAQTTGSIAEDQRVLEMTGVRKGVNGLTEEEAYL